MKKKNRLVAILSAMLVGVMMPYQAFAEQNACTIGTAQTGDEGFPFSILIIVMVVAVAAICIAIFGKKKK